MASNGNPKGIKRRLANQTHAVGFCIFRNMAGLFLTRIIAAGGGAPFLGLIFDVGLHDSAQVHLAEYDDIVKALSMDRPDDAFCGAILPR